MTETPRVQYDDKNAQIDLGNQEQCMKYIFDQVISNCIEGSKDMGEELVVFRKITKNDNIKQTIDKLEKVNSQYICLYSYGPHIQKMLSILEILKRILQGKVGSQIHLNQWNKLTCFTVTEEGRNELLEKRTRVPILITVIGVPSTTTDSSTELSLKGFTHQ